LILNGLMRLLSLAAMALVGWWIARLIRGAGGRRQPRPKAARPIEGKMVRDRVCNTFLPRSSAIEVHVGGQTHYFCSEACRRRFLRETGAAESA
jgi:YHS domain-containing protein